MKWIRPRVSAFLQSEEGPTATEYAVMLALIVIACITVIGSIGAKTSGIFSELESEL